MACIFRCDGCGKEEPALICMTDKFIKPFDWYVRGDEDGPQVACSRECIDAIAMRTGKTNIVSPF